MGAHYTPLGERLLSADSQGMLTFLAQLGVLFLLFFIGQQIDMGEIRRMSRDIVWLTVLNTAFPFILGVAVMISLGYGWLIAFVVGLTRMPTAEAVIVPILDEFNLVRTRVGQFIIGAGVLDDVIEVFLVAFVSVWIGEKAGGATGPESEILSVFVSLVVFVLMTWAGHVWIIPRIEGWLPKRPRNLLMLAVLIMFSFGGFSEYTGLGMVVGAIVAGVLTRPVFERAGDVGEQTSLVFRAISYGFLGPVFFFWVGLSVDLGGLVRAPELAIALYLAGTIGKLLGVFAMVPLKKLQTREAWVIGVGLDARLTTEIIVAKLLLDAGLIDVSLFTALVSASSITAFTVPLGFTLLVRAWGTELRSAHSGEKAEAAN